MERTLLTAWFRRPVPARWHTLSMLPTQSFEKAEAGDRSEEDFRPSSGWLGEVFSCPQRHRLSNLQATFDIISHSVLYVL